MAQAVADAIGATKRQVQLWTDAGVVQCIPETDRLGPGRQRHYERDEIPIAALVAAAAPFRLPIRMLDQLSWTIRHLVACGDDDLPRGVGHPASWYRQALAGEFESFIVLPYHREGVAWRHREAALKYLDDDYGYPVFLIPVRPIVRRAARKLNG
jgi:hypothetical protein